MCRVEHLQFAAFFDTQWYRETCKLIQDITILWVWVQLTLKLTFASFFYSLNLSATFGFKFGCSNVAKLFEK